MESTSSFTFGYEYLPESQEEEEEEFSNYSRGLSSFRFRALCQTRNEKCDEEDSELEEECSSDHQEVKRVSSYFSDAECGEPLVSQHLKLDFTPVKGIDDNAELERKCSDFWRFVFAEKELEGLMVIPEKVELTPKSSISVTSDTQKKTEKASAPSVEWLKTKVGKTMHTAKLNLKCSPDNDEGYIHGTPQYKTVGRKDTAIKKIRSNDSIRPYSSKSSLSSEEEKKTKPTSSDRAVELCRQMEEWDRKHPISMDPPRVVPLSHAVLQRKEQER